MADISTIVGVDGSSYTIKDATARGLLNGHSVGKNVPANAVFTDTIISIDNTLTVSGQAADAKKTGDEINDIKNTLNSEIATRQTYVRPNLLDNWYFVGGGSQLGDGVFPINQRGQTSYSGGVNGIDRWKGYQGVVTTNVTANGLSIHRSAGDFYSIYQKVANPKNLRGKKVTVTLLATGYNRVRLLADKVDIVDTGEGSFSNPINSITATIPNDVEELLFALYTSNMVDTLVTAAKLELGSGQTLAHNEGTDANPVWVLNEIPDYGEQLRRCQRYLYRYNCPAPHFTSTDTYMMFPIVHDFASTPSSIVKSANISWYRIDGVQTTITNETLEIADATVNSLNIKLIPTPAPGSSNKNKLGYITRLNVLVSAE